MGTEKGEAAFYAGQAKSRSAVAAGTAQVAEAAVKGYVDIRIKELDNKLRQIEALVQQNVNTINARAQIGTKWIDEADEILTPISRPFHRHGTTNPRTGAYQSDDISLLEVMFGLWIFSDYLANSAIADTVAEGGMEVDEWGYIQMDWSKSTPQGRRQYALFRNLANKMQKEFRALTRTNMKIDGTVADIESPVQAGKSGSDRVNDYNRVAAGVSNIVFPGSGLFVGPVVKETED